MRLECRGLAAEPLGARLRSPVALLHRELLESVGRVSGFSHPPKGSARSSALQRGPVRAVVWPWRSCFYLTAGLPGPQSPNSCYMRSWLAIKKQTHSGQQPLTLLSERRLLLSHGDLPGPPHATERGNSPPRKTSLSAATTGSRLSSAQERNKPPTMEPYSDIPNTGQDSII